MDRQSHPSESSHPIEANVVTGDDVHKNCEKYCNLRTSSYWLQNLGKLSRDFNFGAFEQAEEQITQKKNSVFEIFLIALFFHVCRVLWWWWWWSDAIKSSNLQIECILAVRDPEWPRILITTIYLFSLPKLIYYRLTLYHARWNHRFSDLLKEFSALSTLKVSTVK